MAGIVIAILVFSFLIISHEFGHFIFAKRCGIGVEEFSVGMGPRIASFVKGETRYSLKAIPFGGSCAMVGEEEENPAENAFNNKSVWARILVVVAGPMFNLVSAFLLSLIVVGMSGVNPAEITAIHPGNGAAASGLQTGDRVTAINGSRIHIGRDINLYLMSHPLDGSDVTVTFVRDGQKQYVTYDPHYTAYRLGISYYADEKSAVLSEVSEGTAAAEAGLQGGDVITAIDGTAIATGSDIQKYFDEVPPDGSPIVLSVDRGGESLELTITPTLYESNILGFDASSFRAVNGAGEVVTGALAEVGYWVRYTILSLRMLITGSVSVREMSGPVGIVSAISQTVETSSRDGLKYVILNLLTMAILLSANLGVLNLLPIPALDGGRLIFLLLEVVRGKPIPADKEGLVHTAGYILLMVLMVFVLFNDVLRLLGISLGA